jgi:hypothetical protein
LAGTLNQIKALIKEVNGLAGDDDTIFISFDMIVDWLWSHFSSVEKPKSGPVQHLAPDALNLIFPPDSHNKNRNPINFIANRRPAH